MSPDDASSVPRETVADTLLWVGVGSSAGGLEALRELARGLPADANATYIVVQHMAPQHKSMLSELIGRETHLPVSDITNGLRPAPNQIYVTPPNSDVFVVDGELRLVEPSFEPGAPKPSVDRFFRSLAEQIGKRAIGVVLSGTGSDGAYGIEAIRAGGGITIAQDDMSAKYQGMPAAAVATGCVDLIMSPADIGAQFEKITSMPRNLDAVQLDVLPRDDLADVFHQLFGRTRVDFRNYKRATVSRRIERRMTALGMGSLSDYVEFLKSDEQEVDALFKDMLISVTSFFRDEGEFETIDEEIKSIVSKNPDSTIRAWIPGCATGEEVYSIAILFAEALGGIDNLRSSALQIFATDIDEAAVIRARKGFYPFVSLENIDPALKAKYFERVDDGFVVKKEIRDLIIFSVHNLINDPPFQNIDFVSCRNLLIYFQPVLQEQVLACLHYALRQSGVLFLGKSEGVTGASDLFRPLGHERHIFRKRTPIGRRPSFKMPEFFRPRPHSDIRPYKEEMSEAAYMKSLFDGLVRAVGPDCLLVDTELRIKRAFGDVSAFIEVSPGEIQADVSSLVKPEFSGEIRMLAGAAIRRKEKRAGRVRRDDVNPAMCKRVSVYPFETSDSDFQLLIAFDSWKDDSPRFDEVSVGKDVDSSELVQALERDLMHAQEALQQTVEELETSNEELQALNEELQSSNEELQSTNEELETTNEELQSSNEELTTINEELHINSQELAALSHDLRSVLENVGIPFIVTNSDLHIIHSSDEAREFFRIRDVAVSRLHVSQCQVPKGFPSIEGFLREALNQRTKITRQLEAEGSSYLAMATPYADERGAFIGVIFSLTDTSEITASQRELRFIFDNVPVRIWYKDDQNNILRLNNAAAKSMGASVEEIEGTNTAAFFPEMAAKYGSDDEKVITSQQPLLGIVERFTPTASEHGWVRTDKIPVLEGPGKGKSLLVVATDVTREKLAEEALRNSEDRFKVAVAGSSVGLWDWNVKTDELYWSPRFMDMVGISESSFSGQFEEFSSRVHPNDLDRVLSSIKAHLERHEPYICEHRLRRSDGAYVWVEARGQAIWAEDGTPIRMAGSVDDITDTRQLTRQLRRRTEQLEIAAQLAKAGHWRLDFIDEMLEWSDGVYRIHGVTRTNYTPSLATAVDFYHPDDRDRISKLVDESVSRKEAFEFEGRIVRPSGEVRHVITRCSVDDEKSEEAQAISGVIVDVTEFRERERRLQAAMGDLATSNDELSRFAFICSHDLKEPVRTISSMSNIILNERQHIDELEREQMIARISANANRLSDIIDSLLAYSRVEARELDIALIDLSSVVSEVVEDLHVAIEQTGADIEIGELPCLSGVKVHFRQVFQNLIGNALKYALGDDPIKIRISSEEAPDHYLIRVEDNGPGVPKGDREKIFSVFSRLHRRDEIEGAGLGLSICRRIMDLYGGTIWCDESDMGGASFCIKAPKAERMHDKS